MSGILPPPGVCIERQEPLQTLGVTVQVKPNTRQEHLQHLLAKHLTPSKAQIESVTSIPFNDIAQRFTPFIGKDIMIAQLIGAADAIT